MSRRVRSSDDDSVAQRAHAAERLTDTLADLVSVYSDMRGLMEVSRTRPWSSVELSRYLELRRRQRQLSRRYAVGLAQHEQARHRAWTPSSDDL